MKNRIVVVLVALVVALAGCGTTPPRDAPGVTLELKKAPVATAKSLRLAPAAVTALPPASQPAKEPNAYASLPDFKKFKKGAGEGVAREYKNRTKAQFIALLRDPKLAKKEMRVSCDVLVRQMAEAHPELPFEGCEGAAAAIASDDYQIIACRNEMFQRDNWLTVTNATGTAWGVWHRKCLPGEQVLVYKGRPLISTTCLNVAIPMSPRPAPPTAQPPATATATCPKGRGVIMYAFSLSSPSMPNDLREEIKKQIAAANARDSGDGESLRAYQPSAVSRTLGARLLSEVPLAPVTADITLRYIDHGPEGVLRFENVGVAKMVGGKGAFNFADDPLVHEAIGAIWRPAGEFISPTLSGPDNLEREIRIFRYEWVKCKLFISGITP